MQIFISCSPEDESTARRLYKDLKQHSLNPWLDQEDLLPGQNWKNGIRQAIRESAYFLTLISAKSVSEKGFVQKQQRMALEVLDELPPDKIFILPVSLDGSKPAFERMADLHPVNLFPSYEKGFEKIMKFLCQERTGQTESGTVEDSEKRKTADAKPVSEAKSTVNIGRDAANNVIVSGNGNVINLPSSATSEHADNTEPKPGNTSPEFQPLSPVKYVWISLAAFVMGMILLSVFINKVYVEVKPDGRLGKVSGKVRDGDGKPLPGACLSIGKLQTVSDATGWFEMEIPVEMQKEKQNLSVFLTGFRSWEGTVYPATGQEVGIILEKE